jgi:hypothetical protein
MGNSSSSSNPPFVAAVQVQNKGTLVNPFLHAVVGNSALGGRRIAAARPAASAAGGAGSQTFFLGLKYPSV